MAYTVLPATDGVTPYNAARDQHIQAGISDVDARLSDVEDNGVGGGLTSVTLANLPAGVALMVAKASGTWPARPTTRADLFCIWVGPVPAPAIVSSGTGGMYPNDLHISTVS